MFPAMPVVRRADRRLTETPNAVMTTLASPTQGGAGHSVWRVDMRPGQSGPLHAIDAEQVWTVLDGGATVELDGQAHAVGPGDTLVMPADAPRRGTADPRAGFSAIVVAPPGLPAHLLHATRVSPPRPAPAGANLVPP